MHLQFDLRVQAREVGDDVGQDGSTMVIRHPDPEPPDQAFTAEIGQRSVERLNHLPCDGPKHFARCRQHNAATMPFEERFTDNIFQLTDLQTCRRLGAANAFCAAGHAASLFDRQKGSKVLAVQMRHDIHYSDS